MSQLSFQEGWNFVLRSLRAWASKKQKEREDSRALWFLSGKGICFMENFLRLGPYGLSFKCFHQFCLSAFNWNKPNPWILLNL